MFLRINIIDYTKIKIVIKLFLLDNNQQKLRFGNLNENIQVRFEWFVQIIKAGRLCAYERTRRLSKHN